MKLTNGQVQAGLDALTILCNDPNRLPTLAAVRAGRAVRKLREAAEPVEAVRVRLVEEHGEKTEDGMRVPEKNYPAFLPAYGELMAEEVDLDIQPITLKDVEAGWSKGEDGMRVGLEISPTQLSVLVDVGLVVEDAA